MKITAIQMFRKIIESNKNEWQTVLFDFYENRLDINEKQLKEYLKFKKIKWFFVDFFSLLLRKQIPYKYFKDFFALFFSKYNYLSSYEFLTIIKILIKNNYLKIENDLLIINKTINKKIYVESENCKESKEFINNLLNYFDETTRTLLNINFSFFKYIEYQIHINSNLNRIKKQIMLNKKIFLDKKNNFFDLKLFQYLFSLKTCCFEVFCYEFNQKSFIYSNKLKWSFIFQKLRKNDLLSKIRFSNCKTIDDFLNKNKKYLKYFNLKNIESIIRKQNYNFFLNSVPIIKEDYYFEDIITFNIDLNLFKTISKLSTNSYIYLKFMKANYEKYLPSTVKVKKTHKNEFIKKYWENLNENQKKWILENTSFKIEFLNINKIPKLLCKEGLKELKDYKLQINIQDLFKNTLKKLNINKINYSLRNFENVLIRQDEVISSLNRKVRFFDNSKFTIKDKEKLTFLILNEKPGFYSTKFLFNKHFEFMNQINIIDHYELHNLIKRNIQNENIKVERMPGILINIEDKKQFFVELINKNNLSKDEFYKYLEKEYGHSIQSLLSHIDYNVLVEYQTISQEMKKDLIYFSKDEINFFKNEFNNYFNNSKFIKLIDINKFFIEKNIDKKFNNKYMFNEINYDDSPLTFIQKNNTNVKKEINYILNEKGIYKNEFSEYYDGKQLETLLQNEFKRKKIIQTSKTQIVTYDFFFKNTNIDLTKEFLIFKNYIDNWMIKKTKYLLFDIFKKETNSKLFDGFIDEEFIVKFICRKISSLKYEKFAGKYIFRNKNEDNMKIVFRNIIDKYLAISTKDIENEFDKLLNANKLNITPRSIENNYVYALYDEIFDMWFKDEKERVKWLYKNSI